MSTTPVPPCDKDMNEVSNQPLPLATDSAHASNLAHLDSIARAGRDDPSTDANPPKTPGLGAVYQGRDDRPGGPPEPAAAGVASR